MQKVQECLVARFDAVRFLYSPFFEHYNYILLCDWVPGPYGVILWTCAGHNTFVRYQVRAGLKPMQPMQLHWAPRFWDPAPWCLG